MFIDSILGRVTEPSPSHAAVPPHLQGRSCLYQFQFWNSNASLSMWSTNSESLSARVHADLMTCSKQISASHWQALRPTMRVVLICLNGFRHCHAPTATHVAAWLRGADACRTFLWHSHCSLPMTNKCGCRCGVSMYFNHSPKVLAAVSQPLTFNL